MTTWQKIALSIVGLFLGGATSFYQLHVADDPLNVRFWIGLVMAGLAPVGGYLVGFFQINPSLQPRTPEALLDAVKKTDLPTAAKETAAEALGSVVTTQASAPVTPPLPRP